MSDLTVRLRHDLAHRHDGGHTCMICEAADALDAAEAENAHLRHLLAHACKNLTTREVENDELHDDVVRLLTEKAAAEAKLAAIKQNALDAAEAEFDHINELYVIRRRKHNEAVTQLATAEAKLAAIDAHIKTCAVNYYGQDDAYEDGYLAACENIGRILHPKENDA